ncbi:MAG: rod shape-determining protein MreD [Phycisphaerae bacterium]|nr:rod shape-determining protein MreD [Phycisphaerae bacterium]
MRWFGFAICAVVVLTLQTTIAWRLEVRGARPDWMLVLAVFFALHTRSMDGLFGAWVLGAAVDIMSIERFGLISACYGASALAIYATREHFFRDNPLTHFMLTFVCAAIIGVVTTIYRAVAVGVVGGGVPAVGGGILLAAGYTAAWAPLLHYALLKFPRLLGVGAPRRSYHTRRGSRTRHV